jgi:hypothetical protein
MNVAASVVYFSAVLILAKRRVRPWDPVDCQSLSSIAGLARRPSFFAFTRMAILHR